MGGIPGIPLPNDLFEMLSGGIFISEMPQIFTMNTNNNDNRYASTSQSST